jgi:isopenicillin N synthase-like dioxygenase
MGSAGPGNPAIPVVDLAAYHDPSASKADRQRAADSLAAACKRYGFAYITNHGFSSTSLSTGFSMSKRMFALPLEAKMKAPHPPGYVPHRGYSYPGLEQVHAKKKMEDEGKPVEDLPEDTSSTKELKESYEIGSETNPPQTNIWLPDEVLPGFRDTMLDFYWALAEGSKTILRAMADGLRLSDAEVDRLFEWHSAHNNQLRLLRYPPLSEGQVGGGKIARMSAHTDWSLFTLLFQEDKGGLELEDPQHRGTWLDAVPLKDALVLNVGEMWQRASNGKLDTRRTCCRRVGRGRRADWSVGLYRSANHFVNLPPLSDEPNENGERLTRERFSIPYFVAPDNDAVVEVFESLIEKDHPKQYEPVRFDKYADWVAENYYDKGDDK